MGLPWEMGTGVVQPRRVLHEMCRNHLSRRAPAREWVGPREQFVRKDAPGVDIGAPISRWIARGLFRSHVRGSADAAAELRKGRAAGGTCRVQCFGDTEIGNDGRAPRQQHILRLHVAMNDALLMSVY